MATTTLTSKGQMTIPKGIRDRLKLKAGDRLEISTEGERIIMTAAHLDLDDLCAILPRPKRRASLAEIETALSVRRTQRAR